MEKNTVLLAIDKYNELRDFKIEVETNRKESKFAVIEESGGWSMNNSMSMGTTTRRLYYTDNEIVLDFEKRNKELEKKNKDLNDELMELKSLIHHIKKMSYFEFRKWKRSKE